MTDTGFPGGVPRGLTYDDRGHELSFSWRWFSRSDWAIVGFAAFWNAMMVVFLLVGFPIGVMFLHLLAGLGVAFHAVRKAVNRTSVELRAGGLTVTSGPILGNEEVIVQPFDLKQLYVKRRKNGAVNGRPIFVYEVHAIIVDSHHDVLVAGNVPTLEQAHFIEAQIERYLEIPDEHVKGGVRGPRAKQPSVPIRPMDISRDQPPAPQGLRDAVSRAPDDSEFPVIDPQNRNAQQNRNDQQNRNAERFDS